MSGKFIIEARQSIRQCVGVQFRGFRWSGYSFTAAIGSMEVMNFLETVGQSNPFSSAMLFVTLTAGTTGAVLSAVNGGERKQELAEEYFKTHVEPRLLEACVNGDIELLDECLAVEQYAKDKHMDAEISGETLGDGLALACREGHEQIIDRLLHGNDHGECSYRFHQMLSNERLPVILLNEAIIDKAPNKRLRILAKVLDQVKDSGLTDQMQRFVKDNDKALARIADTCQHDGLDDDLMQFNKQLRQHLADSHKNKRRGSSSYGSSGSSSAAMIASISGGAL